jgi:putative Holliday junction resolvase
LRILGIDFGDRKIGLAISDRLGLTAQPHASYRRKTEREDKEYFKNLVAEYGIHEVIVGLPLRMDGSSGTRAEKTREFACWLKQILGLPIIFWDERLTTKQANKILSQQKIAPKAKKEIEDQISAVIILSTYLESKRSKSNVDQNS